MWVFLGRFGDKSMEAIFLAKTDEVVKTTIKISTSFVIIEIYNF
jgi:hypothetical protein